MQAVRRLGGRRVGALALVGVAVLAPVQAAHAAVTTHNSTDVGLFGASDPTYDGAFRQSLGILAEVVAGVHDQAALHWLVAQQCADGGWTAYRAALSTPCPATDLTTFTGEDSNSTALAIQALHAAGVTPTHDPLPFLHALQDSDGGFPLIAGSGTDPNSTALAVQAIVASGGDPGGSAWTVGGHTPLEALMTSWLNCGSSDPGAFSSPYSSGHGDLIAGVQAVWGVEQKAFPFTSSPASTQPVPDCTGGALSPTPATAGQYAATWLAGQVAAPGYLTTGSSPDYSLTAQGVLAWEASGTNKAAIDTVLGYLTTHAQAAVLDPHGNLGAGNLGYIALAAHADGLSVRTFGGLDLVALLQSSRRALPVKPVVKPVTKPVTKPATPVTAHPAVAASGAGASLPATGAGHLDVKAGVAVDLLFVGGLLLLAGRRRRRT
jgi:hypothetical protein